jgi:hypothetical protein
MNLRTSSRLAGLDSRNFAAPARQIPPASLHTQSGRQSGAFLHSLGQDRRIDDVGDVSGVPPIASELARRRNDEVGQQQTWSERA